MKGVYQNSPFRFFVVLSDVEIEAAPMSVFVVGEK
jgi:hypothetical protein